MLSEQKWTKSKLIFLKSGTLFLCFPGIIDTLPSLWVRSAFALGSLLRVEAKGIQNGMKKP